MDNNRPPQNGASEVFYYSDELLSNMEEALDYLLEESEADYALLLDRTGCVMANSGTISESAADTFGATAAGVVAALQTMMSQATSPEVSVKLYGAEPDKIHFVLVSNRLILCVIYCKHTSTGQVRAACRSFIQSTKTLLSQSGAPQDPESIIKSAQYIEGMLDDFLKG